MKKSVSFLLAFFLFANLFAQKDKQELFNIQLNFVPDYIDFSPDDKYLVMENANTFEVWNVENQEKIIAENHRYKINRISQSTGITEGSGYFLFEQEKIFLTADYTLNHAELTAYDLESGDKLWNNDKLDMDISLFEQFYRLSSATNTINTAPPSLSGSDTIDLNYFTKDQTLSKLINYMPEWSSISVNGSNGLQVIDLKTGATRWNQQQLKGGIGEIFYNKTNDIVIAIRVHNSEIENLASKPKVHGLNAETGALLWTSEYIGDFIPNTAFVSDGVLVLPYFGLRLIDVKNGHELNGDVKESMQRARKAARTMSVAFQAKTNDNNDSKPLLDEQHIIHYMAGYQNGKHLHPVGGRKAYFQIDLKNDKFINVEEKLAGTNNRVIHEALSDKMFYVKVTKGMSKTYIIGINRQTAELVFETDNIKNRFGSEYSPFTLYQNNKIVDLSSKGVFSYDANTGEETSFIKYKDIGVGKFRSYTVYKNGLVLFGSKGVALTDHNGKVKKTFEDFSRIKDYRIGDEIWLVEKKRFTRIDAETLEAIENIHFKGKEDVFFSPSGSYFVRTNQAGNKIKLYKM